MSQDFSAFVAELHAWSLATFPGETVTGKLEHLKEEVDELMPFTGDLEEFADCAMLLYDALLSAGFSVEDLHAEMARKLNINRGRDWHNFRHIKPVGETA